MNKLHHISYKDITITDALLGSYSNKVYEKIIPHMWNILNDKVEGSEPSYCIHNFKVAAGLIEGERKGVVFLDTDLYKWLEAVSYCLASGVGKEYEPICDEAIELIGKAQEEDGYLNTFYSLLEPENKWKNLRDGHELYSSGHMIEAAVAYYEATGKDNFIQIAKKNADLICKVFGTGENQMPGYPGHQEVELALVKLYRVTGEKRYLNQAKYFIYQRGKEPNYFLGEVARRPKMREMFIPPNEKDLKYGQSHLEPIKQRTAEGHSVRAMYMYSAMADLALELGDKELEEACLALWENTVNRRMYITAGIGSSGFKERFTTDFDLPNTTGYSETCASVGLMMFGQRMNALTKEARFYDIVERAIYNTVLAGINIAGDRYFYVNPLEVIQQFCTEDTYMDHVKGVRQKWFTVACCPPNVARTLASIGQYIYATDDESLYVNMFVSSNVNISIGDTEVKVEQVSRIAQDGTVSLKVNSTDDAVIKVRIPEYATKVNDGYAKEKGYLIIPVSKGEENITLDFGVKPEWIMANNEVREDVGKVALKKGPFVYCLEEVDNGDHLTNIYVNIEGDIREASPDDRLVGEIPTLKYNAVKIAPNEKEQGDSLYYKAAGISKTPMEAVFVPYCLWNNRGKGEMSVWTKMTI